VYNIVAVATSQTEWREQEAINSGSISAALFLWAASMRETERERKSQEALAVSDWHRK
jgi:hypothetical protein